jgi:sialate O-acetylesterase
LSYHSFVKTSASRILVYFFLLFVFPHVLPAEPRLPHLFSDHMILQRDVEVAVWGWADPGEQLSVTVGPHKRKTAAGADGRWNVSLPATPAGGPYSLVVQGKKTIVFKDVLFGEVWVASGQSNMTYALSGATGAAEEIPKAKYDEIRFFTVPKKIALTPQEDTDPAAWEICSPDTAKAFSAVAYFFARDLHRALGVPVGIVLSAWPGTAAEEWTDPESLRREAVLQPIVQRWDASAENVKAFAMRPAEIALEFDDFELLSEPGDVRGASSFSNFDDGSSRTGTGGIWTYNWSDAKSTAFDLVSPGRGGQGYAARIAGNIDGTSSSNWQARLSSDDEPVDMSAFAGIRFWVRGSGSFQFQTLQLTISDWDNYSTELFQATPEWRQITIWFKDLKQAGWGVAAPFTPKALTGFVISSMAAVGDPDRPPSGLYEGMIVPLQRYNIRGAIWYQGEGNTWRAQQYQTLLPALIQSWRKGWGAGNFPFLIVQLPNHGTSPELGDSIWAELREAQLLTAKAVPNAGLAVTIDVGEEKNLHPPRKEEIGQRLALWVLGTTYARKIVYSGPLYDSSRIVGNEVRIRFRHAGGGLEAHGEALKGFSIAGADHKFHWATARIDGAEIVVSSAEVSAPEAVRYGWAGSPECNLYNKEGLPASPFRTDLWPGETAGRL